MKDSMLREDELRHEVARLREQLESAQRELAERRQASEMIVRAKAEAEAASACKSDFLAMMSHEIRTPLHGILGMNELLLSTPLSDKQREFTEMAARSARMLLDIINDILDLSRIESGMMHLSEEAFSIRELVKDVVGFFSAIAADKQLELKSIIGPGIPNQVWGDPGRIRQILVNLVGNAVKFTDHGVITIGVEVCEVSTGEYGFRFRVQDSGIGITPEQATCIFDKFRQADGSITRRFGGTGLGLTISKRLVEMMRGDISVESVPGKGSTFTFEIRLNRVKDLEAMISNAMEYRMIEEPALDKGSAMTQVGNLRVLLVEDNPSNQAVILEMLNKLGCKAELVENGNEAVEVVIRKKFDIVFMDCQLPGISGFEAVREIRQVEKQQDRHTPIVAVTAYAMATDRQRCLDAGMDDYLAKPVGLEEVREVLTRFQGPEGESSSQG